jgi:phosphoglycolate phosphatase-like HAD superfamily hydrolase
MIRNVIWDVDGTLFDTYPAMAEAFRLAVKDLGNDASIERITATAKQSLGTCVSDLANTFGLDENEIGEGFEGYYSQMRPADQPPFPGVIKICSTICAQGGRNLIITHRGDKGVSELLTAHHMSELFSGQITRDDGYPKKPDPEAFIAMLQQYQLNSAETITVGDRDIDILAGQAAGIVSCLFGDNKGNCSPDFSFTHYDELDSFLLGQNINEKKPGWGKLK